MKYYSTVEDLEYLVTSCGFKIVKSVFKNHIAQLKLQTGAVLRYYTTTGTLQFQGDRDDAFKLKESIVEKMAQVGFDVNGEGWIGPDDADGWQDMASAPRDGSDFLVQLNLGEQRLVTIATYQGGRIQVVYGNAHDAVFWQPLPEPRK